MSVVSGQRFALFAVAKQQVPPGNDRRQIAPLKPKPGLNGPPTARTGPQGLKPKRCCADFGAAEAAPYQAADSLRE
jgi:hypothetical protein